MLCFAGIDDVFLHVAHALIKMQENQFLESDSLAVHNNLDHEQATTITVDQTNRSYKSACCSWKYTLEKWRSHNRYQNGWCSEEKVVELQRMSVQRWIYKIQMNTHIARK